MMKTLDVTITVRSDGTVSFLPVPPLEPGTHHGVLVVEAEPIREAVNADRPLDLAMLDWSAWPSDSRFSREEIYGDDEP